MGNLSPSGILLGVLATQVASYVFGFVILLVCLAVFGTGVLVAFFENPAVIAVTLLSYLLSGGIGGYVALLPETKSTINAIIVGMITLAFSTLLHWFIDFKYAIGHEWMLTLSWMLTIPCAYFGGRVYISRYGRRQRMG
jgi:hypothetical protein